MNLDTSIKLLEEYVEYDNALNSVSSFPFWVKDVNCRFKRFNDAMLNKLYPKAKREDLYNRTDWEYAEHIKCSKEVVEKMKNCCRLSDELILSSKMESGIFLENFQTINGENIWLLTAKTKLHPKNKSDVCIGVSGQAIIFPEAEILIKTSLLNIKKLSDNCYLWGKNK